jgi:broad specificity phosphatase PhoE
LKVKVVEKSQMSEINPGVWDGLTPDQAKKYYPDEWDRFVKDPYVFRAPRAESYHDLCGTLSKSSLYYILIFFRQFDWSQSSLS